MKTKEEYIEALCQDIYAFRNTPDVYKTAELCLAAVKENGRQLEFVPMELRTKKLCLTTIRSNG